MTTDNNNITLPTVPSESTTASSAVPLTESTVNASSTTTTTKMLDLDTLLASHKKQLRDLQALITQKKKSASKKTRRGVNDECERLERGLKEKQRAEVEAVNNGNGGGGGDGQEEEEEDGDDASSQAVTERLDRVRLDDDDDNGREDEESTSISTSRSTSVANTTQNGHNNNSNNNSSNNNNNGPSNNSNDNTTTSTTTKKPNRQKARLARRQQDLLNQVAQAAEEAKSQPDLRALEQSRMSTLFSQHSVIETQIAPDGHCLYSAFAHGLNNNTKKLERGGGEEEDGDGMNDAGAGTKLTYKHTRSAAASYITSHPDDFAPFLLDEDVTVAQHADSVKNTAEWGGEMELLALAKRYNVVVKIIQAEGNGVVCLNSDDDDDGGSSATVRGEGGQKNRKERGEIWLAYHRRGYGLGEHYNALTKKETKADE